MSHRVNESRHEMRPVKPAIHTPAAADIPSSSEIGPWCLVSRAGHESLWHLERRTHWQIGGAVEWLHSHPPSRSRLVELPSVTDEISRPASAASKLSLEREELQPLLEGIPMNNHAPA
jgi:hypothetical protein